jgi:O-antigen/teichoic acid export membrane protein
MLFPLSFLQSVLTGLMRGLQKFKEYSILMLIGPIGKLILGVGLVILGFGVTGAISGLVFSGLVVSFASFFFLRKLLEYSPIKVEKTQIIKYSFPVLLSGVCLILMTNIDVILVKYFFSSYDTGIYVAASTLVKVILFTSGALVTVMFPKVSDMHEKRMNGQKILRNTIVYTLLFSMFVIVSFWMAPQYITTTVFGKAFEATSEILLPFAVAIMLISLVTIIVNYDLAIKRTIFTYPLLIATAGEIFLIYFFHASLMEIITILIAVNTLLFFTLLFLNKELIVDGTFHYNTSTQ